MKTNSFIISILRFFLVSIIFLATSGLRPAQAQDYQRLQNRWKRTFIHLEHGPPKVGSIQNGWLSAMWKLEKIGNTPYFRIKNRWKGTYLHNEHGRLQAGNINNAWWSAMWSLEKVAGTNYSRIKNRWKGTYLHTEKGGLDLGRIQAGWHSAMWEIKPVSASSPSTASNDPYGGFIIESINVTQFPVQKNGKRLDAKSNPDLFITFFEGNQKRGKSEKKKDCHPGSKQHVFSGYEMPFRVKKGVNYFLKLYDHDEDRRNDNDLMSGNILVRYENLTRNGRPTTIYLSDRTYGQINLTLKVRYASHAEVSGRVAYVKHVKPINQVNLVGKGRLEGCGPVAAAMVMGYWQTERGYKIMNAADRFNGAAHPSYTIQEFYRASNSHKSPGSNQSYTRKMNMKDGLAYFAKKANQNRGQLPKLEADLIWQIRKWSTIKSTMKNQLLRGNPVVVLFDKTPGCIRPNGKAKDVTKVLADHYVTAVGFNEDKKEVYVLNGWDEEHKSITSGPQAHSRSQNDGICTCSYKEMANANPGIVFLKDK